MKDENKTHAFVKASRDCGARARIIQYGEDCVHPGEAGDVIIEVRRYGNDGNQDCGGHRLIPMYVMALMINPAKEASYMVDMMRHECNAMALEKGFL